MDQEKANHPITMLCRVLEVSTSGYYAWRHRKPSVRATWDARITKQIATIHTVSHRTYGSPRIHAELAALGIRCGRKRVARLMRTAGVVGCHRRRYIRTTKREAAAPAAPDRVGRQFVAPRADRLWTGDITYIPTQAGFLFLAVVLDVHSRRIVGWAMANHLRTELVVQALEMALRRRRPAPGLIYHSDRGCQYTSVAFAKRCKQANIERSTGSRGDCYDNAITESFFATLQCEMLQGSVFRTHAQARTKLFEYIEGFYNPRRLHSALGYLSPAAFEQRRSLCAA